MIDQFLIYNVVRGHYESVRKLERALKANKDVEEALKRLKRRAKSKRKPWPRKRRKKKIHK